MWSGVEENERLQHSLEETDIAQFLDQTLFSVLAVENVNSDVWLVKMLFPRRK